MLQDRLLVLNRTTGAFKILKDMITSRQWTLLHVCNVILTPGLASSSGLIFTQILSIFRAPSPPTSHGYMSGESKMPSTPPLGPIYYYKWFKWSPDRSAHCKHQNVHAFPLKYIIIINRPSAFARLQDLSKSNWKGRAPLGPNF